jgi:phage tail sheath gpL-like
MAVQTVVASSVLTPGLYLEVNLLAGTASSGTGTRRIALLATQSSAGDLTDDTEVRTLTGTDSAVTAFGNGTLGHLAAKIIYDVYPEAVIDAISPTAGAGTATLPIIFTGAPTSASVVNMDVLGRTGTFVWEVGESVIQAAAKAIAWINERDDDLPMTAVAGAAGVLDINSKVPGNIGNDFLVRIWLAGQTGTEAIAGAATHTNLASGTTDPDLTTALASLAGRTYRYILPALSNADVGNIVSSNNPDKIYNHIITYNVGKNARLQQQVVGYTGALATIIASTPHSNSFNNDGTGEVLFCINGRSAPAEWGAREVAGRAKATSLDPAANRIDELLTGVVGSWDKNADQPTASESEQALGNGVSLVGYTPQDAEYLIRAVTTHSQTAAGAPDRRLLDTQNVDATFDIGEDIQAFLPVEFAGAKLAPDNDAPTTPLPAGVTQPRDVKAWLIKRVRGWVPRGVVDGDALDTSVENNEFIVEINSSDASQLDIVVPERILPPLAKMGVLLNRQPA